MTGHEQSGQGRCGAREELLRARGELVRGPGRAARPRRGRARARAARRVPHAGGPHDVRGRAGGVVRRVRADLPRAGLSRHLLGLRSPRLPSPDARGAPATGRHPESDGARARCLAPPVHRPPVLEPARGLPSPRPAPRVRGEPYEASREVYPARLGRHRARAPSGGIPAPDGAHLENLVLHNLLALRDARVEPTKIFYRRVVAGDEVDFVVEFGERLPPVEVKATRRPTLADAAGLRAFRAEYGAAARPGFWCTPGMRRAGSPRTCWPSPGGGCSDAERGRLTRGTTRRSRTCP